MDYMSRPWLDNRLIRKRVIAWLERSDHKS